MENVDNEKMLTTFPTAPTATARHLKASLKSPQKERVNTKNRAHSAGLSYHRAHRLQSSTPHVRSALAKRLRLDVIKCRPSNQKQGANYENCNLRTS